MLQPFCIVYKQSHVLPMQEACGRLPFAFIRHIIAGLLTQILQNHATHNNNNNNNNNNNVYLTCLQERRKHSIRIKGVCLSNSFAFLNGSNSPLTILSC